MFIQSLKLKNWMNVSECSLEFSNGINIIEGAVGEGKSAIFAAIAYVLSEYKRGDSWKDYIKTGEKFFDIELVYQFTDDPNNSMKLHYKGEASKSSVYKEITYQGEIKKGEEVPIFLEQHVDQQMLSAVIFNLQGSQPLAQMSPAERRDIFKKIFNSDFEEILQRIKADKEVIQKNIDSKGAQIEVLKNKEYSFFRIIAIDPSELTLLQEELQKAQGTETLKLKINQYLEKVQLLNSCQTSATNYTNNCNQYLASLEELRKDILDIEKRIEAQNVEIALLDTRINKDTGEIVSIEQKILDHKNSFSVEEHTTQIATAETLLINTRTDLSIARKYLKVHQSGKCTECGQDCNTSNIATFEAQIERDTALIQMFETTIKQLKDEITSFKATELLLNQELAQKKNEKGTLANSKDKIVQKIQSDTILRDRIRDKDITSKQELIESTKSNLVLVQKQIAEIQEWLENNPKPELSEMSRDVQDIQKAIEEVQARIQNNINRELLNAKLKKEREKDVETVAAYNLELNAYNLELSRLTIVNQIFTTDFPNFINMKACKILESYMNNFFLTTKDHFEVALQSDKKGVSFYYKANGEPDWRNIKMVSGFESALSTLAFKVAVAFAFGADFIFLDEPEANADVKTAERLFETLLSVGGFKQIFVITHKPEVIDILFKGGNASGYSVKKGIFSRIEY